MRFYQNYEKPWTKFSVFTIGVKIILKCLLKIAKFHLVFGIVKKKQSELQLISSSIYNDVTDMNLWILQKREKHKNQNILTTKHYFDNIIIIHVDLILEIVNLDSNV